MRYGPQFSGTVEHRVPSAPIDPSLPAIPVTPVKGFAEVSISGWEPNLEPVNIHIEVKPFELAATHQLNTIHVVAIVPGTTLPADPAALLASGNPQGSVDVSSDQGGKTYPVPVPNTATLATADQVAAGQGFPVLFQTVLDDAS